MGISANRKGPFVRFMTWNINSVRLRLSNLARLVAEQASDVICLQETKAPDVLFRDSASLPWATHIKSFPE